MDSRTEKRFDYLLKLLQRKYQSLFGSQPALTFGLQLAGQKPHVFGKDQPAFTIVINDHQGLAALASLDATKIAEAYLSNTIDMEGDLLSAFALRHIFSDRHRAHYIWNFLRPLFFGQAPSDHKWIAQHYDHDADFFLLFLDKRHRCYSQGVFVDDNESLEDAMTRKLEFALEVTGLKPGQHVLDIGTGWGSFVEFAGKRGTRVTSLTISKKSEEFANQLIAKNHLPCKVIREHLLEYKTSERYDAIVNSGVTEHLPDYGATLAKYQALLKPGGRVYLDASAARQKFGNHSFATRYIFPGNGSLLCLHDYLSSLASTSFALNGVHNDRHSYYLTTKSWAKNLDEHRDEIVRRWGLALYRIFRIYLYGCVDSLTKDKFQAYRVVLELPR